LTIPSRIRRAADLLTGLISMRIVTKVVAPVKVTVVVNVLGKLHYHQKES